MARGSTSPQIGGAALALAVLGALALALLWPRPDNVTDWSSADLEPIATTEPEPGSELESPRRAVDLDLDEPEEPAARRTAGAQTDENLPLVTVRGRVVDPGARPVAAATVHLSFSGGDHERMRKPTRTAADGTFAFRGPLRPASTVTVLARHEAFAPSQVRRRVGTGSADCDLGDIVLGVGARVRGSVSLEEGGPAVGATLDVLPEVGSNALWSPEVRSTVLGVPADASGAYELAHLPPGTYRLVARAPRRVPASSDSFLVVEGSTTDLPPIALAPGRRVAGTVVDANGSAVAKARVVLVSLSPPQGGQQSTQSDADGRFEFDNLRRSLCELRVTAAGHVSRALRIEPAQASEDLRIELGAGLHVDGVVVDAATGAPIPTFAVQARRLRALPAPVPASEPTRPANPTARPSLPDVLRSLPLDPGAPEPHPGGRFVCGGLDEGVYAVDVRAPGYVTTRSREVEVRQGLAAPTVELGLGRGHTLQGTVRRARDDTTVAGARVEAMLIGGTAGTAGAGAAGSAVGSDPPRGPTVAVAITGPDGGFACSLLPAGTYAVRATAAGLQPATSPAFALTADTRDLRLSLASETVLRGTVHDIPAARTADVTVVAFSDLRSIKTTRVDADGSYRLAPLRPGVYYVRAYLAESRAAIRHLAELAQAQPPPPASVTIADGEEHELDLRLEAIPMGDLRGTVRINGVAGSGSQLRLEPPLGLPRSRRTTPTLIQQIEADGGFAFQGVEADDYQLVVLGAGRQQIEVHRQGVRVLADQTTVVDVDVSAASLEGRVVAPEDGSPVDGTVSLSARGTGADPVTEFATGSGSLRVVVRGGRFRIDVLPAGAFVLQHTQGGERKPTREEVVLQRGERRSVTIVAGERL